MTVLTEGKLDHIFELILVLLSILSAAEFGYFSHLQNLTLASPNNQKSIIEEMERNTMLFFRVLFIPLVFVISLWLPTQMVRWKRFWRIILKEYCFGLALIILMIDTTFFVTLTFPLLLVFESTRWYTIVLICIFAFLIGVSSVYVLFFYHKLLPKRTRLRTVLEISLTFTASAMTAMGLIQLNQLLLP